MAPLSNWSQKPAAPPTSRNVDDWEEWEDEHVITPIDPNEQVYMQQSPTMTLAPTQYIRPVKNLSSSRTSRQSFGKIKRLKSRQRQKAQNAKAGIRLITDMSALRRQNPVGDAQQPKKFVDAAALRALEGEPNSASVGNWNWLKRDKSPKAPSPQVPSPQVLSSAQSRDLELSPNDRPVLFALGFDIEQERVMQPEPMTATVDYLITPVEFKAKTKTQPTNQPTSVWSPDTPDTIYSFKSHLSPPRARPASSVYSQITAAPNGAGAPLNMRDMPPVPALPAGLKKTQATRVVSIELQGRKNEEDDSGTPCTLFEEDGDPSPLRTVPPGKGSTLTPDSAGSRGQGWWDHVVSPFSEKRMSLAGRKQKLEASSSPNGFRNEKKWGPYRPIHEESISPAPATVVSKAAKGGMVAPIVKAPTPRRTSPPPRPNTGESSASSSVGTAPYESRVFEKPEIIVTDASSVADHPPPYSPAKKMQGGLPLRYRAVFPPGHPLQSQFPPSPRPASPGLAGTTMTSQGSPHLAGSPLTPPPRAYTPSLQGEAPLTRPTGTYLPEEHAYAAHGHENRIERQRRRYEKEEVVARRAGGFWRGRGCIPAGGCFGRTGREGRKRRRIWLGVCTGIIAVVTLVVVLAVVLSRQRGTSAPHSIWVNLTDYPPMPTGVLTVVGPDNSVKRSSCTEPSTLWSCSLPKDEQSSVVPYKPNQPTAIFQIQWDNSTRNTWKIPNGDAPAPAPAPISKRAFGLTALASNLIRSRDTAGNGFNPSPKPPGFREMWFMGETTDDIQSDQKAGEPTPFYISLLPSVNATISEPTLSRREGPKVGNISLSDILPAPELDKDGTPAAAKMLPQPVQQPVRLFDRGLPTEHYGFYTHFRRTIYLKSVKVLNSTNDGNVPLDEDGGCRKTEANFLTTWGETRLLVRIWTRKFGPKGSSLIRSGGTAGIGGSTTDLVRPGTMPYPVTMTLDTHGGDATKKLVWDYALDNRQRINPDNVELLANNMAIAGTWINPRGTGDAKFGGFDGGTGGCKCEWVNWI